MALGIARRAAVGCAVVAGVVPLGAGAAQACDGGHHDDGVAGASYTIGHSTENANWAHWRSFHAPFDGWHHHR